ncbi:MAG: preprotein translocase subunit SecG [Phycisphaerae bacterium]|nr:preprotein translocase subunit SecG [Phycisphaerae bacterium]|tara:strand:+ start:383 stop:829 length:447 start_codon:yes stop_codon:yes gene_type:complete
MTTTYLILTAIFIVISVALILIILVQRPAGGGLAGAFGGAGGGGTESVFGGRVGDALTVMTVLGFCVYLGLAIALNLMESRNTAPAAPPNIEETLLPFSATDPFEVPGDSEGATPSEGATSTPAAPAESEGIFTPSEPASAPATGEGG